MLILVEGEFQTTEVLLVISEILSIISESRYIEICYIEGLMYFRSYQASNQCQVLVWLTQSPNHHTSTCQKKFKEQKKIRETQGRQCLENKRVCQQHRY